MSSLYLNETMERAAAVIGARVALTGDEARHAATVNRTRVGDRLSIGNGVGVIAAGVVVAVSAAEVVIEVDEVHDAPRPTPRVWLAQALAKGDRDELAIQAATELGVDGVIPWAAQRSVVRWEGAKLATGHARWAAIVREATKQSIRPWLPEVSQLASTAQLVSLAAKNRMLVLDPDATLRLSATRYDERDIVLVVGPEGGIAPDELERLVDAGASVVRLGATVLRTSTAGPAAIAVLNVELGRW